MFSRTRNVLAALVLLCCPPSAARATAAPLAGWEAQYVPPVANVAVSSLFGDS